MADKLVTTKKESMVRKDPSERGGRVQRANLTAPVARFYRWSDTFYCALISTIVFAMCTAYCCGWISESSVLVHPIQILDVTLAVSFSVFFVYWLSCICPIWLGAFMLFMQISSGIHIGHVFVKLLQIALPGANSLGGLEPVIDTLFFFLLGIWPIVAFPLYKAILESSPLRRTLGFVGTDIIVGDLRGRRLSFPHALKKSVVESFERISHHLAVATGRSNADLQLWVDEATSSMFIRKPEKVAEEIRKSRNRVSVRYRAFQALEGVVMRADNQYVPKMLSRRDIPFTRALHGVGVLASAALFVFIPITLRLYFDLANILVTKGPSSFVVIPASYLAVWSAPIEVHGDLGLGHLIWGGIAAIAVYLILSVCRPTHVELTKKGLRFVSGAMPAFMQDPMRPWKEVKSISIEQPEKSASIVDYRLAFHLADGKKMRMRLGSITSVTGKEEILKAIERWAPRIPRDVEVIRSLQPPLDYSYTELWLEALAAPPKRDKLKPLIEGAALKEHQYVVKNVLGSGGQGSAYLVEDCLADKTIVLKEFVLPVYVDVAVRRKALEAFEHEARLLKSLDHPQVVKLVDYFIEDHRAYLVLEHIDGDSLRTLVAKNGPIDEKRTRELAWQMCDILDFLHTQSPPVVHRDFTPDNLILRKDGTLKLIDFNVAQQTDATTTGTVVGKPSYIPAEQFRGLPTVQSDIYAMGASLYYLLSGEDPTPIASSDISTTRPEISFDFTEIIKKATQPEPEERFSSAHEVKELLAQDPTPASRIG